MGLGDKEDGRVVGAPLYLDGSLLERLVNPVVDCPPVFHGYLDDSK